MTKLIAISALVSVAALALPVVADAQITAPPGEEFYAAPMSHGGPTMAPAQIVQPAPPPAPVAAPAPAPAPVKKHRVKKHTAKQE